MSSILVLLLNLVVIVFLLRAVASWIRIGPDSRLWPVVDVLYRVTEPILAPIRRVIPPLGGIDLSVLVVILGVQFVLVPIARSL